MLQCLKKASNINTTLFFYSLSVGKKHSDFTMIWNSLKSITKKFPTIKFKIHFITFDSKQKISRIFIFNTFEVFVSYPKILPKTTDNP